MSNMGHHNHNEALPLAESVLMPRSLVDPAACVPNTAVWAGRHQQDSHWDVSDALRHCQSSAESEPKYTQPVSVINNASRPTTQTSGKFMSYKSIGLNSWPCDHITLSLYELQLQWLPSLLRGQSVSVLYSQLCLLMHSVTTCRCQTYIHDTVLQVSISSCYRLWCLTTDFLCCAHDMHQVWQAGLRYIWA